MIKKIDRFNENGFLNNRKETFNRETRLCCDYLNATQTENSHRNKLPKYGNHLKYQIYFSLFLISYLVFPPLHTYPKEKAKNQITFTKNGKTYQILSDPKTTDWPKHRIWFYRSLLWVSGDDKLTKLNRQAATWIQKNELTKAQMLLENGKKNTPQFFPFRYNLGYVYFVQNKYKEAIIEFQYAERLMPHWSKIHIRIGECWAKLAEENNAIDSFKQALKINPRDVEAIVALGDHYYSHGSFYRANIYYQSAVKINKKYMDAQTGLAKVLFAYQKYYDAVLIFKTLDYKKEVDYDKAFHFYYGESLYKLGRYKEASIQYETLLQYPSSRFFLTNAIELIRFKLDLAKKFSGLEK